jgi:hypothetical protein
MTDDDIDRILSCEEELLPSSGFAASVMDAVRREAALPPPIPFPWKRAVPGIMVAALSLIAVAAVFVVGLAHAVKQGVGVPLAPGWESSLTTVITGTANPIVAWTFAALILTVVSVILSLRLADSRG